MTASVKPISRFPVPELKNLPDDIREKIMAVQEKAGFVPNVFLALSQLLQELWVFTCLFYYQFFCLLTICLKKFQ